MLFLIRLLTLDSGLRRRPCELMLRSIWHARPCYARQAVPLGTCIHRSEYNFPVFSKEYVLRVLSVPCTVHTYA